PAPSHRTTIWRSPLRVWRSAPSRFADWRRGRPHCCPTRDKPSFALVASGAQNFTCTTTDRLQRSHTVTRSMTFVTFDPLRGALPSNGMPLQSLLISRDAHVLGVLRPTLEKLAIE